MNIGRAFTAALMYIVALEIISAWRLILNYFEWPNSQLFEALIDEGLILILVLLFLQLATPTKLKGLPQPTRWFWYLWALLTGVCFVFAQYPINSIYNAFFNTEYEVLFRFNGLKALSHPSSWAVFLLAPLAEELYFRQYIQKGLLEKTDASIAVFLSSVFFAFIHWSWLNLIIGEWQPNWHQVSIAFIGGLISAWLYQRSKSVGPSSVMHICWNLTATLI